MAPASEPPASEPPPKKTRGPTRCHHIWDAKHPIIRVEVNANGIPIGKEGSKLTRFLGTIARKGDLAPLDYFDWRDLPKAMKDHMWGIVEGKFQFHPIETSEMKGWVLQDINTKWKGWKNALKDLFYDDRTDVSDIVKEATEARTLDKTQFENLVKHWRTDKAQQASETNTENKSKSDEPHNAGTMSFARLAEEMGKDKDSLPEPWEIYVKTRSKKDGTFTSVRAGDTTNETVSGDGN